VRQVGHWQEFDFRSCLRFVTVHLKLLRTKGCIFGAKLSWYLLLCVVS